MEVLCKDQFHSFFLALSENRSVVYIFQTELFSAVCSSTLMLFFLFLPLNDCRHWSYGTWLRINAWQFQLMNVLYQHWHSHHWQGWLPRLVLTNLLKFGNKLFLILVSIPQFQVYWPFHSQLQETFWIKEEIKRGKLTLYLKFGIIFVI